MKNLFKHTNSDLSAGLVVYLVALPLCLGIAAASTGNPQLLFSGIISGIVGGIIIGIGSGSKLGVSGPAAGLVTIVFAGISNLGSFQNFLVALVLAGIIQLIMGFLKAGIIAHYFPSSVIKGMLAAIGILLILKEIPHALGYDKDAMGDDVLLQKDGHNTFSELYYAVKYNSIGAIIISTISLGILILFEKPFIKKIKAFKLIPGSLIVVILGIILNTIFIQTNSNLALNGEHLVQLPVASSIKSFLSFFTFPDFSALKNFKVYEVAFTLAIVASIETLLSVEAIDKLDPDKNITPTNRELKAQGLGNIVSGLIGGLPITQVIVRSSANLNSGGKSKLSTITHGFILLISAIFIPKFLNQIPMASLATILIVIGYKLAKVNLFKGMYKLGWEQFIPFIVTIIVIISSDLLKGIIVGIVFSTFYILRKNYKNSYHLDLQDKNPNLIRRIRLSEEVSFLNKGSLVQTLNNLPSNSSIIIDGSKSEFIDYDVVESIYEFKNFAAKNKNIEVELIDIPENEKMEIH